MSGFENGRPPRSCLAVSNEKADWVTAKAKCLREGARLVEINTPDENALIMELAERNPGAKGY